MKTFSYYLCEFIVQSISEMFKMLSDQNINFVSLRIDSFQKSSDIFGKKLVLFINTW